MSFEYGRLTSVLIDGFFDHAAVVTNKLTVIEAVGDRWVNNLNIGGVREVEFEEWLYKKDYVAIVRPIYNDGNFINKLASREALVYKGKNYDYSFTIGPEKLYCSEIPYLCYRYNDSTFMNWVNENTEILPQMYYELTKNIPKNGMFFKLIYDSRGAK